MDMDMDILQPAELPETDPAPDVLRGFSNPEILQKAQETRASNREGREPKQLLPDGGEAPKTRGRPKKQDRNLQGIEQLLLATHLMVASATGYSELILSPADGHMLADAFATLADNYKIKLDGKTGAVMGLIYAVGAIYGPRAVSIAIRVRNERRGSDNAVA